MGSEREGRKPRSPVQNCSDKNNLKRILRNFLRILVEAKRRNLLRTLTSICDGASTFITSTFDVDNVAVADASPVSEMKISSSNSNPIINRNQG